MAVLQRLARAEGQVVSRNDILDEVWPGAEVTDDVLTHCVTELRKAFGDSPHDSEVIETIPKMGLRLLLEVKWIDTPDSDAARPLPWIRRVAGAPSLLSGIIVATVLVVGWIVRPMIGTIDEDPSTSGDAGAIILAVLPFSDLSVAQDQQHLATGLPEELALRLMRFEDLMVFGPPSALIYGVGAPGRSESSTPPGADFLLDGSIRGSSEQIRITAQLTEARTGIQRWGHAFDTESDNLLDIESKIADAVAHALSVELDVGPDWIRTVGTSNPDAYEELLRGDLHFDFTPDGMQQALVHYTRASVMDLDYAMAWQRLAMFYNAAPLWRDPSEPGEYRKLANSAIERALRLAPDSEEILLVASSTAFHDQDWSRARRFYDRALTPRTQHAFDAVVPVPWLHVHFNMLYKLGYVQEQIVMLERLLRLGRLGGTYATFLPQAYLANGRLEDALAEVELVYASPASSPYICNVGVSVAMAMDDIGLLKLWLERAIESIPFEQETTLDAMQERLGDRERALDWLRHASDGAPSETFDAYHTMQWATYYDDIELALDALHRFPDLWSFWTPVSAPLRRTEEFKQIVTDMGLVEYWREHGWNDYCKPTIGNDFECQ